MADSLREQHARDFAADKYVAALDAALAEGGERIPQIAKYLTTRCPECNEIPDTEHEAMFPSGVFHLMAPGPVPGDPYEVCGPYVAIGCEGYAVVNPNALGIPVPNWDDWTTYPGAVTR